MNIEKASRWFFPVVLMVALALLLPASGLAATEDKKEERPERSISMAPEYPWVVVPAEKDEVEIDLMFSNKGRRDEVLNIQITSIPPGWKARIKTYQYTIRGVMVPEDDTKRVTFLAEPPEGVKPGDYTFRVQAQSLDGHFKLSQNLVITVKEKGEETEEDKGVELITSYPVLRGPSDAKFEFSLEVKSKLKEETIFNLFAKAPEGWEVNFKPAYESKYISSVRLKENGSQSLALEVKPPHNAEVGEYTIPVTVAAGKVKAEGKLTVVLTGTYEIKVGTPNDLLSLEAYQGKPANVSIYVKNTGTATNHNIKFLTFKPENWKVEFKPERIDVLKPGELKQVEVTITPYQEALVGDYSVTVGVEGEKAKEDIEFRVRVKASAAWGWFGLGIIVLVVAGLLGLFRWIGRR